MLNNHINKPQKRGVVRKYLSREFYIIKRHINWYINRNKYAEVKIKSKLNYSIIKHRSFLLRPLKNVDMYLQHNKVSNLRLAIQKLDKLIIKPGQLFSVWKLVGRPTILKGYLDGLVLNNGNIEKGIGGGLCQLGNLLYWMALHTPLSIVERWRHSYDVFPDINRTIPFACGATLSHNYIDLQIQNNTSETFQINLWLDDEYLNGEITCDKELNFHYDIFETDHMFHHQWWGGYTRHNKIWRKITNLETKEISEEFVSENSAIVMYSPLLNI